MLPDLKQCEEFLLWAYPNGPWVLTAIPVEGGRTTTVTFVNMPQALAWVEQFAGKQNLYWTVNKVRGIVNSKPKKADLEEAHFLHVDIDPRKGEDAEGARKRIVEKVRGFKPAPSAIVDSGGGIQCFWKLDEPFFLGGHENRSVDVEAYNRQFEMVLGGDHCWNVDRLMRLVGSPNIPDAKKLKAGRVERLATVIDLNTTTHSLGDFTAAPVVQAERGNPALKVTINGNVRRIADLDELPERVTPRTRMLIVQGDDADDPTRYSSKSEVMWAVLCELVRADCDDDTIAAILLDPDFGISDHPLRQKRSLEYVARQIERAREEVIEPMLRLLNEKHSVIADMGGKCRIISEVMDHNLARPRTRISMQSFEDFRNRYMHVKVEVGKTKDGQPVYTPAGKWWLTHPLRSQFESMVFAPLRDVEGAYNLWRGFACEAIPSAAHEPFLEHLRDNVCAGNEVHYRYLLGWMARAVQRPGEPGQVAVILRGGKGAGKGTVAQVFGSLWGRHFLHISSAKHLVGQFNAHLRDCVFLFADEAFFAGDKQHESVLKTLVTEDMIMVEKKGVDAEPSSNFVHLLMASNEQWVVPAGTDERRYFVLDVGEGRKQDVSYFKALVKQMEEGGREALLHFLMTYDLSAYEVRDVPQTQGLREQKIHTLGNEEQWWMERLTDGRVTRDAPDWHTEVQKDHLMRDYIKFSEDQKHMRRVTPTLLGRSLNRFLPEGFPKTTQRITDVERDDGRGGTRWARERVNWYTVPSLEACRDAWDKKYNTQFDWPVLDESGGWGTELADNDAPF